MTTISIQDEETTIRRTVGLEDDSDLDYVVMTEAFFTMLMGMGFTFNKSSFDMAQAVFDFNLTEPEAPK